MKLIISLFSGFAKANELSKVTYISDKAVESEHYEIKKISGNIDNSSIKQVFYVKESNTYILQTQTPYKDSGSSNTWVDLWRINKYGYLIDTFSAPNQVWESGTLFEEKYYIDWAYTGDRSKKLYSNILNADLLTTESLEKIIAEADQIYSSYGFSSGIYRIYARQKQQWVVLETKKYFGNIGSDIQKANTPLVRLTNEIINNYDFSNSSNLIFIDKFNKYGGRSKSFFNMDLNSNGWNGNYGKASFTINHKNEKIHFSAFNIVKNGISEPDIVLFSAIGSDLLFFELHGRPYNQRPSSEIGIYVLRQKRDASPAAIVDMEKSGIDFGHYLADNTPYDWLPIFEGFSNYPYALRRIRYFNGTEDYFNDKLKYATAPLDKLIPKEFDLYFSIPKNSTGKKFDLTFGENIYTWDSNSASAYLTLNFEKNEISEGFKELSKLKKPIEVVVNALPLKVGMVMSIQLRSGDKKINLESTTIASHANMRKNDIPFDMWPHYLKQYHWQPTFVQAQRPKYVNTTFYTGENYKITFPLEDTITKGTQPVPRNISFAYLIAGETMPDFYTLYLDEAETIAVFEKLGNGEMIFVESDPKLPKGLTTVRVFNSKESITLKKFKIKDA